MEKIPQTYDPTALTRILQGMQKQIESLQSTSIRRYKSVAQASAQNLRVNEVGYSLDDSQNFDLLIRGEDSRLYRISGQASAISGVSSSGGTTDHGVLTGLSDDDHTQYHNDSRALTWLGTRSTSDLPEGSNLYFTNERAQDAIGSALTDTATVDFTYNDGAGTISAAILPAGIDHGGLGGLTDNDHPQYEYFSLMMS